jgi:4-amino-4-deoxy-L-arabinose transferase-like glycosyltransferase
MLTIRFRPIQFAALGIVLLTIATRLPSLQHPQAIDDEAAYSVVANEIVDGGQPYIDAVDRKPPLLFWTYAAVFEVAGKYNWMALHTVALVWTLGTMAGLYVIGRQLFSRETGLIAALLYSVFQPWAGVSNLPFNGEVLMNLPIVWAWAIGFRRSFSRIRPDLLAAGALLCAGFLLKQPAAIAAVPLGLYLLLPSYRNSFGITRSGSVIHATMLTVGFFVPLGLMAIVLQRQGILRDAFYWTIGDHTIPYLFWGRGVLYTLAFAGACLPLVIGAAMSFRDGDGVWGHRKAERIALIGLLVASALGAAASFRFYPHYYIQLIPPLALLAGPHYARLWTQRTQARYWFLRPSVTSAWLAATVVTLSVFEWRSLALRRASSQSGRYLSEHSASDDRIFIWGPHAAEFYLEAGRRPACRYVLTFPLTGFVFGGDLPGVDTRDRIMPGAWRNLEEDFRKHPPVYIADHYSGPDAQYPVRDFPILARLLAEHYQPVARTAQGVIYRIR